jgi:hypothetical protein
MSSELGKEATKYLCCTPKPINNKLIEFDAGHNRDGFIEAKDDVKCMGCGERKRGIVADNSDGEYASVVLCKDCFDELIEEEPDPNAPEEDLLKPLQDTRMEVMCTECFWYGHIGEVERVDSHNEICPECGTHGTMKERK